MMQWYAIDASKCNGVCVLNIRNTLSQYECECSPICSGAMCTTNTLQSMLSLGGNKCTIPENDDVCIILVTMMHARL